MDKDKRKGEEPVPDNAIEMLNQLQILALRRLEGYGWRLQFIRRPLFQDVVAVMTDGEGNKIGVLEEDGRINMEPELEIRE
ncbi:MAG: hypothetical protein V3V50_08570 [Gammaproteobacteria bacterium]